MKDPMTRSTATPDAPFIIPLPLRQELAAMVEQTNSGQLLALAKHLPELGRGLRLTAANAKYIRQRLATRLLEQGELNTELRFFLAHEGLNGQLVMVLSQVVLAECLPELMAIHGRERLLAALLVDDRPEVRQLAAEYCRQQEWQDSPLPERDHAVADLAEKLEPFLAVMASLSGSASSPVAESAGGALAADLEACRRKIVTLEERLRQLKEGGKAERKREEKLGAAKQQLEEANAKLVRERQARMAAQEELVLARQELEDVRQAREEAIRNGIEAEMQARMREWLLVPARLDQAVAEFTAKQDVDILERVNSALSQQAERDRHFGNRTRLRQRLLSLREAEETLLRAAAEALNPLPELTPLLTELQAEISRLARLLDEQRPETPVSKRLAALIGQADNQGALARVKALMHELMECGCLSPEEGRTLYQAYHACLGRLFDRFSPAPLPVTPESDPALIVSRGVSGEGRFHWLLDGYNILFGLPEFFAEGFEEGRPTARARQQLLEMVDRHLAGSASLAEVFFDGAERHQENFSPRVRVIYSGGGQSTVRNRADQAILDWIESQPPTTDLATIVVTNDRELMSRCQALAVRVMPLLQFAALLAP